MAKLQLGRAGQLVKLPEKLLDFEPTHASRYWILTNILTALGASKDTKILDVGGKKGLLRAFPGFSPMIIDIEESDEPNFTKGDALDMPFTDGQFDYAVSCDVLEHIPKKDRKRFLLEMLRVSAMGVILCAPFDNPGNSALEKKLNDYYAHLTGQQHRWLREHIDNGLPSETEVEKTLKKHGYHFVKFRHFSPQAWEAIVGQHLLHAAFGSSKDLETMIHAMYRSYYNILSSVDFSDNGYRTFFWISKKDKPELSLPPLAEIQEARSNFLVANNGMMLDFMERQLRERQATEAHVQRAKAQEQALAKSNRELELVRAELRAIKSHPAWKALHHIRLIIKPDKHHEKQIKKDA